MNLKSKKANLILHCLAQVERNKELTYNRFEWGSSDIQSAVQWLLGAKLLKDRERNGALETVGFSRFYHQLNDKGYSHKDMISLTMDELKTLRQELINQEDEGKQVHIVD